MANENLVDGILSQLGPAGVAQIASSLGVEEEMMGPAVAAAIPAILGGMATNTRQPAGAESLSRALDDHSPSIFDALGGLLGGGGGGGALGDQRLYTVVLALGLGDPRTGLLEQGVLLGARHLHQYLSHLDPVSIIEVDDRCNLGD